MRLGALASWLLAIVLVAAIFTATQSQAQHKPLSPDAAITEQVERVLAKDPSLKRMEIYVETLNGVVSLRGFVRSLDDIARAGKLTRAVSGVSAVRNGLRVANRPSQA